MSIKSLFEDIADAIREKSGSSDTYTPAEMPSAIRSIPSGSSTASGVSYDNTSSGLTASNVQDAIDELAEDVSTINSDLSELLDFSSGTLLGTCIPSTNSAAFNETIASYASFKYVAISICYANDEMLSHIVLPVSKVNSTNSKLAYCYFFANSNWSGYAYLSNETTISGWRHSGADNGIKIRAYGIN